MSDEEEIIESS